MAPRYIVLMITLLIGIQMQGASRIEVSKKSCKGINIKIGKLQSQLRRGYAVKKGEVWKKQLRVLKKNKYDCWKKRFSTQ